MFNYFLNYNYNIGDVHLDLGTGQILNTRKNIENWEIDMIDTGQDTLTGGRLARLETFLKDSGTFMLSYGDGVADIDLEKLVKFHKSHNKYATVTAVRPAGRFGVMKFNGNKVIDFHEKPQVSEGWINGGFFVFESEIFNYLEGDHSILEGKPMEQLVRDGQLMAYKHRGFWHCMDTPRDRDDLNKMWLDKTAKWKVWEK